MGPWRTTKTESNTIKNSPQHKPPGFWGLYQYQLSKVNTTGSISCIDSIYKSNQFTYRLDLVLTVNSQLFNSTENWKAKSPYISIVAFVVLTEINLVNNLLILRFAVKYWTLKMDGRRFYCRLNRPLAISTLNYWTKIYEVEEFMYYGKNLYWKWKYFSLRLISFWETIWF